MNAWVLAIRPKTLPASISPVIIGLSISGITSYVVAILTLVSALLLQISSNIANDYYDGINKVDGHKRLGPARVMAQGLFSKQQIKLGLICCFALAFLTGSYLMVVGGLPIVLIGFFSLLFAYLYTGGPFPLSYYALGELLAFIFFGPIAVCGTIFLQTKMCSEVGIIFGVSLGIISAAIMSINNLRDILSDQESKKRTIAILIGEKNARLFTLALVITPALISLYLSFTTSLWYLVPIITIITFKDFKKVYCGPINKQLNQTLANCGRYMFLYSLANVIVLQIVS